MKFLSCILLFFFTGLSLQGQNARETASIQIKNLKNGFLIVRLKTGDLQASALEKAGNKTAAKAYLQKREEENKAIAEAFRKHFHFCPVYFCYTSSSEAIRQNKLKGVLLNAQMQPDSTLAPPGLFLTAEFGFSEEQNFEGLIVMDTGFVQLRSPFPWIVKKFETGGVKKRDPEQMVILLNKELVGFYDSK
jgi:hypothetical protein